MKKYTIKQLEWKKKSSNPNQYRSTSKSFSYFIDHYYEWGKDKFIPWYWDHRTKHIMQTVNSLETAKKKCQEHLNRTFLPGLVEV